MTAADAPTAPAVERDLAFDMVRRGLPLAPVLVAVSALIWGGDGAWSALVAIVLVLANLVAAAVTLGWAATVSPTALMATALAGFLGRMVMVCLAIAAVRNEGWIDLTALGVLVLVTHLGLLFAELRHVSASLAFPGLRPHPTQEKRPA